MGGFNCHIRFKSFHAKVRLRAHISKAQRTSKPFKRELKPVVHMQRDVTDASEADLDEKITETIPPYNIDEQGWSEDEILPQTQLENLHDSVRNDFSDSLEQDGNLSSTTSSSFGVAWDVWKFYNKFGDISRPLFQNSLHSSLDIPSAHPSVRDLISYCMQNNVSQNQAKSLYNLVTGLEKYYPPQHRNISRQFNDVGIFFRQLESIRRHMVRQEGWKKAIITTQFGVNETRVFQSVPDLMLTVLKKTGGVSSIVPFQKRVENGERVFSAPWDSVAYEEYHTELCQRTQNSIEIVYIEKYFDGHILSASCSQSASNLRVRFCNIIGESQNLYDVVIAPWVHSGAHQPGDAQLRIEQAILLQRFHFALYKDLAKVSHIGTLVDIVMVYPRLLTHVEDQKQERQTLALKSAGSTNDCTPSLKPFRYQTKKHTKPSAKEAATSLEELPLGTQEEPAEGTHNISNSSHRFAESTGTEAEDPAEELKRDVNKMHLYGVKAESRDVTKTVSAQLLVSGHTVTQTFFKSSLEAKRFLQGTSFSNYPPATPAFAGLGSPPYRLYRCVAFDKLHVVEHGIMGQLCEHAHKCFLGAPEYAGIPRSKLLSTANRRMMDLPKAAKVPRKPPFPLHEGQRQSGVTGLTRRLQTPFLWVCVMALSRSTEPDEEPLLQACLSLDLMHRMLIGINEYG
ncbi:hypothetical protein FGB62_117g110 [Gracilaria domingensis]|nr:hypothetical protein FGB62_117g110 [Gracilaria domingensis]